MSTQSACSAEVRKSRIAIRSHNLRSDAWNAIYGVADYLAQPLGMLLAAPFLVHSLGLQQFGIWMLVSAVLGSMGVLGSGFGDATIKYVSAYRGVESLAGIKNSIRGTLTINAAFGGLLGTIVWIAAPLSVHHVFKIEPEYYDRTIQALRIASVVMLIRSVEGIFVSALRAFERYGATVRINLLSRSSVVVASVVLALLHFGVVAIMVATLAVASVGLLLQACAVCRSVGIGVLVPTLNTDVLRELLAFGCFSWFQAVAAVAFMHADRLLIGALLGTSAVAYYTICLQATQPIHGVVSAALNFLFPHISSRHEAGETSAIKAIVRSAIGINVAVAAALSLPLILFSRTILGLWMGPAFAQKAYIVLSLLAFAHALLAINVVPHYTLMGLGKVRYVSMVNVLGGLVSLGAASLLIPSFGLIGAAMGRLFYGPITFLNYRKLGKVFELLRVNSVWQTCNAECIPKESESIAL